MRVIYLIDSPIFYDTDCLVSFLVIGEGNLLHKLFSKIIIPKQVYNELSHPNSPPIIKNELEQYNKDILLKLKILKLQIRSIMYMNKLRMVFGAKMRDVLVKERQQH